MLARITTVILLLVLANTAAASFAAAHRSGPATQGGCQERGVYLPNGTSWHLEPCIQCQCHSTVTFCTKIQCPAVNCSVSEELVAVPQECCPKCALKLRSCVERNMEFEHGATWSLSSCVECQCYNGTISCERARCQNTGCPKGKTVKQSPEACCPQCISTGRSCTVDSATYNDGAIWSPLPCTQCQCENGFVQCYVAQCQPLSCPLNHTLEFLPGKCCPICVGYPCADNDTNYTSGTHWKKDLCTHCSCEAGRVSCYKQECASLSCSSDQKEVKTNDSCCSSCATKAGWCTLRDGTKVAPNTEVELPQKNCKEGEEVRCSCVSGDIICKSVKCQRTSCGLGMKLQEGNVASPLCTCRKCVPDLMMCYYDRRPRMNGEIWPLGCRLCGCFNGEVSCYAPSCPACPDGFYALPKSPGVTRSSSCCPDCIPLLCPLACLDCLPLMGKEIAVQTGHVYSPAEANASSSAAKCRACREGYLLQNGQCVDSCSSTMFARSGRCVSCDPTCLTCTDETPFHCTSCPPSLFLRGGECVNDCGEGYYPNNQACQPCHASCQECSGDSATDCQVCQRDARLLNGSCVDVCPADYVAREGVCEKCSEHCEKCGIGECLRCKSDFLLQEGKCVAQCQDGFYEGVGKNCQACHPSCLTCSGPGISSCTSCPQYLLQADNLCLSSCPPATFKTGNKCDACHKSCSSCFHEGEEGCIRCRDPGKKILRRDEKSPLMATSMNNDTVQGANKIIEVPVGGRCVERCPEGHGVFNGSCVLSAPLPGCETWHPADPLFCSKCSKGLHLQDGVCVQECSPVFYSSELLCLECSPHCASCFGEGADSCETCAPWSSLYRSTQQDGKKPSSKCLTKCRKHYYFYPKLSTCRACHDTCEDCVIPVSGEVSVCVICKNNSHVIEGDKCMESCSPGFYLSEPGRSCRRCHSLCKTCSGPAPNECRSCSDGLVLTNKSTCEEKPPCDTGLTASPDDSCTACSSSDCQTCSVEDVDTCTFCKHRKILLLGKCVDKCPPMFYYSSEPDLECKECHWACNECHGPHAEDCTECGASRKRQENSCVATCSEGYFERDEHCFPCPGGCKECSAEDGVCTSCKAPYFLQDGDCVPSCNAGSFPNVWENVCDACGADCESCSMVLDCQRCRSPYLVQNGKCVKECGPNHFPSADTSSCYYNADKPKLYFSDNIQVDYERATAFNSTLIRIFDLDTPRDKLFVTVVESSSNTQLYILNANNTETIVKQMDVIRLQVLDEGRLMMKYKVNSPFHGELKLKVNDGTFESLTETVVVNVVSRFSPEIVKLEPLIIRKGGKTVITEDNLKIIDVDSKEVVIVRPLYGPSYGTFTIRGEEISFFTIHDLEELQVTYEFSASKYESLKKNSTLRDSRNPRDTDSVLLQAGDGYNYINFLFTIFLVDSSYPLPVILHNRGAKVKAHQKVQITKDILQAKGVDSVEDSVVYSLIPNARRPISGSFVLVIPLPSTPVGFINDGWIQMDETHLLRPTTSFTQRDINEGRVWYVHSNKNLGFPDGSSGQNMEYQVDTTLTEYATEQLAFSISDSSNPPNILKDQTFIVQIEPPNMSAAENHMTLTPGAQLGITVLEGQAVTITPSHLSFSGVDSSDHLVYTISRPLGPNEGSLFHIDSPGLELRQFTQSDVNDMKIIYMPPLEDIGDEDRIISFKFTISDESKGQQVTLPEKKFTIRILPVESEEMSYLHPNPEVKVSQLGTIELDPKFFLLTNIPGDEVTVFLLEAPRHGTLTMIREGKEAVDFTEETEATQREILDSRVLYTNDGSQSSSDSVLFLALDQASEATTRISFRIRLKDNLQPRPHQNATFTLYMKEGETKIISYKVLHFTDLHSDDEELVYTLSSQPVLGDLLLMDAQGNIKTLNQTDKLLQADISSGRLSYSSDVEIGLETATERLLFNVTDSSNNALTNQVLKVAIRPNDNRPPNFLITQKIKVPEGGSVALSPSIMNFSDIDSPMENLKLVLNVPPLFGHITNTFSSKTEESFRRNVAAPFMPEYYLKDIVEGKISYIQSRHKQQEPTQDTLIVHLSDGINRSPTQEIKILIEATNDEGPLILGEQVSVERGSTVSIQNVSLFISDPDTDARNLTITVEEAPKHGTLHKKMSPDSSFKKSVSVAKGEKFTFQDILQELLFYSHDGSKAMNDFMEIKVSDGNQETGGILEFLVRPQAINTPRLLNNKGLKVGAGQISVLRPSALSATDEDSSINDLSYIISVPPQLGKLQLYRERDATWQTLTVGSNFLQSDIVLEHVRYVHTNVNNKKSQDQIHFHIQDAEGNILLDQEFNVTVELDTNPPRVTINKGLTVNRLSSAVVTPDILWATDSEVDPMIITYTVAELPRLGHFERLSDRGKAIKTWNQKEVELGQIIYRQTVRNDDLTEAIQLSISDGSFSVSETFLVKVPLVDEILPVLFLNTLKVQENSRKNISQYEIRAQDPDTQADHLTFILTRAPKHGMLQLYDNEDTKQITKFTMKDVIDGKVSYLHDGNSSASEDSLEIAVFDRSNKGFVYKERELPPTQGALLQIDVLPVKGGTPVIQRNKGIHYLEDVEGKARKLITTMELNVTDDDSSPGELNYKVTDPPTKGVLRLNTNTRPVSSFTQADINAGKLYYELTTLNVDATEDKFLFDIVDQTSNSVPSNAFHIQWSWIFMSNEEMNVDERDGIVHVFVKRTGNINLNSSVQCSVQEISSGNKSNKKKKHGEQKDYVPLSLRVDFNEASSEKYCEIAVTDDKTYEGKDSFVVILTDARYSLVGRPKKTIVHIRDDEDRPSISFESSHYTIEEDEGLIFVPLRRHGDIDVSASVMCVTKDLTASGSNTTLNSLNSDFIRKLPTSEMSKVVFPPGIAISTCDVKLIDDSIFEAGESLELYLENPSTGVSLGEINKTTVTIKDPNDQSQLSFEQDLVTVDEYSGKADVVIRRSGSDLDHTSSVWCASKPFSPEEATANIDYIPFSKAITFQRGQPEVVITVIINDDKANPKIEGPERFIIFMSAPQNASLSPDHNEIVVFIKDDEDAPQIEFSASEMHAKENETVLKVPVIRSGDLRKITSVYCFTRQRSAKGGIDFVERPNSESSVITFPAGVSKIDCEIGILDDLSFEYHEEFIVRLRSSSSPSEVQSSIGQNKVLRVTILDPEDKPRITFEKSLYTAAEPSVVGKTNYLIIPVVRKGDDSKTSKVIISSQNGSALSHSDFEEFKKITEFSAGSRRVELQLGILHNPSRKWNKSFKVVLEPEGLVNGELGILPSTTITILDHHATKASVFPAAPRVVSLLHYDTAKEHYKESASPGYPLVCITSCEQSHPEYSNTRHLCEQAGLQNLSAIKYAWEVAVPGEEGNNMLSPFAPLTDSTLFASSTGKVLDSMYFASHFTIRCVTQPAFEGEHLGLPLRSSPVTISSAHGICSQPGVNILKSQNFEAKLSYLNFTDSKHPNTIEISVQIPHQDGMIPLISTIPLHNIRHLLTDSLYRTHHVCSNLHPESGFMHSSFNSGNSSQAGSRPYQWDFNLREMKTLILYQHLDLTSCMWTFVAWYSMSELTEKCGGQIISDFQVGSGGQSFLTVRVPFHLSYVYASSAPGWTSLDHRTELSVSFYYNTVLWNQGLLTEPSLTARIQITRVYLDMDGRLVIKLSTVARFRGQFIITHPRNSEVESRLVGPERLNIPFTLELVWSAATWDGPQQIWRATSNYTVQDYTGEYILQLVPCTVIPSQSYHLADPPECTPHYPTNFTLPLAIQQIQQPVPLVYTLNTDFQLFNNPELFLTDPREVDNLYEIDYKGSFGPGQTVYGRVLWHPHQDLTSAYQLVIQKVFLCTGVDGYIPKYDPTGEVYSQGPQFGCTEKAEMLKHRYLILDREAVLLPEQNITSKVIEAYFTKDLSQFDILQTYPGVDGFLLKTDALFKNNSGLQWFLQVLYTIGPNKEYTRNRRETTPASSDSISPSDGSTTELPDTRELIFNQLESLPSPASLQSVHTRNGTNMRVFQLSISSDTTSDSTISLYIIIPVVVIALLLVMLIAFIKTVRKGRRRILGDVVVVRSLKNEREEARRKDDFRIGDRSVKPSGSPVTLNSESNLQTIKVKTLAVTVRNNLEEDGTEV